MRKLLFLSVLGVLMVFASEAKAQANIADAINTKFLRWSSEWSADSYVAGSVSIANVDTSDPQEWFVTGTFSFTRFFSRYTIGYTALLKIHEGNTFTVIKLCYDDSSMGMKDCKNF